MKNFNILNFLIVTFFATAQITPAEPIYYEYDAPDETGAMKRQAEKLKLVKNQMIRDELTEAQKEERAVQEAAFKAAYEKQKDAEAKKTATQEAAAKKIQKFGRDIKESQQSKEAFVNLQTQLRYDAFKNFLKTVADKMPYKDFNELVCTADYITKTDWLYQLIEKLENKKIFARDENGTIDPDTFLPEFKKQVKNPNDWLDQKMIEYLPKFHQVVYEIWMERATYEIAKNHMSWTDAVSIPTPKGHGSLQAEGTPLYPIFFADTIHHLGVVPLVEIFVNNPNIKSFMPEPTLNFHLPILEKDFKTMSKNIDIEAFGNTYTLTIMRDRNDRNFDELATIEQNIENHDIMTGLLKKYLNKLGLEILAKDVYYHDSLSPIEPVYDPNKLTHKMWTEKYAVFKKKSEEFEQKFIEDHINRASSARQTFLLGQLLFDNNLEAFDELGDKEWLAKQPEDVQKMVANQIEKLENQSTSEESIDHAAT